MHECIRCGYNSELKNNIKRHLCRKIKCNPVLLDLSTEECLKKLYERNFYKCICCNKEFDRQSRLDNHKTKCKRGEQDKITQLENKIIILQQKPEIIKPDLQFVYILREREFIKSGETVYKIGKTINPKNRMSSYSKGSDILGLFKCENCDQMEKLLIETFDETFVKRKDIGLEYYQGEIDEMIKTFVRLIYN